jgi:deoxyribonuclease I
VQTKKRARYWPLFLLINLVFVLAQSISFNVVATPANYSQAKKQARVLYQDHRYTFYCGCRYDKHSRHVDLSSCGYQVQRDQKRAKRLEWEHVVPVSFWGQQLACWRPGSCGIKRKCAKGRSNCRQTNALFRKMEADLHNLVPEIGELNALRSNYRFGVLTDAKVHQFGGCQFKIDHELRRVEPDPKLKGMIARIYLYMEDQYKIKLSRSQRQLFVAWNNLSPPDKWEIERNRRITHIQGNHNPYVSHYRVIRSNE